MSDEDLAFGPDFLTKYGPLLQLLEHGEEDWEFLTEQPSYTRKMGRAWRRSHCRAVLGYMRSIRTDFEVLWQQTSGAAVRDAWLGQWLGDTERQLVRLERKIRLYVLIQNVVPVPGPRFTGVRKSLLARMPLAAASEFREMFSGMLHIHQRGGATVYLP
jgi:hypothetical protein